VPGKSAACLEAGKLNDRFVDRAGLSASGRKLPAN